MRQPIRKRLSGYWKMEAANVVFLPLFAVLLAHRLGQPLGVTSGLAWAGALGLLIAGAVYWRAKLRALDGHDSRPALRALRRARVPLLSLTLVGVAAALAGWAGAALSPADRWTATAGAVLGALEYVNYYAVQLQHFDRASDFRRLLTGRGFRPAHLARDLAALDARLPSPERAAI
jgi:hypothetical protein